MAEGEKKNWTLEVITVIAICLFLWWKTRKKSTISYEPKPETMPEDINPNPLLDPYRDAPLVCDEIMNKPLAPFDIQRGGYLNIPVGTCLRGDGTRYGGNPEGYGSAYMEQQAEEFSVMKQDEAVLNLNKKTITFRLINSTAVKVPVQVLDTTQDVAVFDPAPAFNDWFLPSKDELNAMYTELHLYGVGNFADVFYWSSSEFDYQNGWSQGFSDGSQGAYGKSRLPSAYTRAIRAFTSTTNYALRDIGPAGGLIFWKSGYDYLEAAPSDQSASQIWSNIDLVAIGATAQGTAIGTGQANTTAIINQHGGASDWFLPSKDELNAMKTELRDFGLGDFIAGQYWSSSESNNERAWRIVFDGSTDIYAALKGDNFYVRACRAFTSVTNYNLRDIGPAGGYIFWKSGNDYLEAAPVDQSGSQSWSDGLIYDEIGVSAQGTAIGTGLINSNAIIGQLGHVSSGASLCLNYDNSYTHTDSAAKLCNDLVIVH